MLLQQIHRINVVGPAARKVVDDCGQLLAALSFNDKLPSKLIFGFFMEGGGRAFNRNVVVLTPELVGKVLGSFLGAFARGPFTRKL